MSDRPEGPYKDLYAPWFDPGYSVIDADIFVDTDGTPYLYFSRNGSQNGYSYGIVYGVKLTRDLAKPVGDPVKLLEASQPWERINWADNRESVSIAEVLGLCIEKKKDVWTQWDKVRVGRCLRAQGWERFKARDGHIREWRFRRTS